MRNQQFEVGSYAVSKWGYDQTNVDFYKVTRRNEMWVWLQPVQAAFHEGGYSLGEYVVPTDIPAKSREYDHQGEDAKVIRRKLVPWAGDEAVSVNDYALAYPWTQKPEYQTHTH